ncbi:hypothetical protein WT15_11405 [Burkholderia stagnalis]|uniref:Uncharacterized protein n=1 Tax=Burkholderia stagnalis TaxID=1503054 RepID=A0A107YY95_9BURK|nr:hypothetical protein WT74_20185 [Burkholderia stagnalis]KVL87791.1 hypothetical protein WT02_27425 [Burkholderia stagnalis]KVM03473.1 hypothetical protein WT04_27215 [Burkholderia stagnalis]KVM99405.1 hypothetical protein WT07_22420 [Burkholderia stagnalis]KVN24033.1 hypothetical protein WT09_03880 [Burkholderia stagnalis]
MFPADPTADEAVQIEALAFGIDWQQTTALQGLPGPLGMQGFLKPVGMVMRDANPVQRQGLKQVAFTDSKDFGVELTQQSVFDLAKQFLTQMLIHLPG